MTWELSGVMTAESSLLMTGGGCLLMSSRALFMGAVCGAPPRAPCAKVEVLLAVSEMAMMAMRTKGAGFIVSGRSIERDGCAAMR